ARRAPPQGLKGGSTTPSAPRRPWPPCWLPGGAGFLKLPLTKSQIGGGGPSGDPRRASCPAEIGPAVPRKSPPLSLISRISRCGAGVSIGLILGGKVRITAERTVSSTREKVGCSAFQPASPPPA